MGEERGVLAAKGGFLSETYRERGLRGCAGKLLAALRMSLPVFALGRRTNKSVGAYFDLITDDARTFYGDSFHFGYFKEPSESFAKALENHTDLVAGMAKLAADSQVLDVGCGICAPAIRIARNHGCHITGVNISAEQVRQGQELVARHNLSDRIIVQEANALKLPFEDSSFDSLLCIEVAGDICVSSGQKKRLMDECFRVLKPGGSMGFSDLVFTGTPSRTDERVLQSILYHRGAELVTDWPALCKESGFEVERRMDIIKETMATWDHSLAIYESRQQDVERRFGRAIARRTLNQLRQIPDILSKFGSFVVISARKPGREIS
ncbi:MAG: methyltransferase domain-containing protein [bacterium]